LVNQAIIYPCEHLLQVCDFVQGASNVMQLVHKLTDKQTIYNNDFSQVKGQYHAKRALEIAASGGHNLLLVVPPGSTCQQQTNRNWQVISTTTFRQVSWR
jgi:magnesium chelatase family protein